MIVNDDVAIQAYPNPFSIKSTIEFTFTSDISKVTVDIYSLNGEKVASLFEGPAAAETTYSVQVDGEKLIAGIYIYRITTPEHTYYNKLILNR